MASLTPFHDPLGRRKAAHLLRRASFGATRQQIDEFAQLTPQAAVERLLPIQYELPQPPIDPATGQSWVNPKPTDANSGTETLNGQVKAWWLHQMLVSPLNAVEKLTYFMHTHFTNMESRMRYAPAFYYQVQLFRYYALGNFKTLSKKICLDNAMLRFLDGHLNEVGRPNENFAREFFELYTVGKGPARGPNDYTTFTEDDVLEASRVFSGCKEDKEFTNLDPETGFPRALVQSDENGLATRHDAGIKQFSAAFGGRQVAPTEVIDNRATAEAVVDEIDQLVEMVFDQDATARHICRKLYRFFVYYEITDEVEQQVIEPLAVEFKEANYELKPVLRTLFSCQHFYDMDNNEDEDNNVGAIIKSPLELMIGTFRFIKLQMPDPLTDLERHYEAYRHGVLKPLSEQGLDFCEPFEVAGYAPYHQAPAYHRNWISTNFLARRYEFSRIMQEGVTNRDDVLLYRSDIVEYVKQPENITDPENPELLVRELVDYLLPEEITDERFQYFLKVILLDNLSEINWRFEWQAYRQSGDDSAVRVQLENLLHTIIQSPEYQLS
jgi:uncharacterized protein (DUF1800 family)